jgi:hypothetical protein
LALVVDEAQRLTDDLLEEIRLLANIETPERKLLPLVLAGQPELGERLRSLHLRQLRQRVSLRCEIGPFELPETAAYMDHRIRTAGGQSVRLFTREAVTLIHERSRGIPRMVNVLGDNALVAAFAKGVYRVTSELVIDVCRDLDLADTSIQAMEEPAADFDDSVEAPASLFVAAPNATAPAAATSAAVHNPAAAVGSNPDKESAARDIFGRVWRSRRFLRFG